MSFNEKYLKGDNTYLDYDRFVREGGKLVEVDIKDRVFRVLLT